MTTIKFPLQKKGNYKCRQRKKHLTPIRKSYSHALDVFGVIKHVPGIALFSNDGTYTAMVAYWQFCETKLENEGDDGQYDPVEVYNAVEPEYEKLANVFHKNVRTPEVAASINASGRNAQSP